MPSWSPRTERTVVKGLALAERYFLAHGQPLLRDKYAAHVSRMAVGLVGDGSECFGFDDQLSQDHDWGPGFCVWLTRQDYAGIGNRLREDISALPTAFEGYTRLGSDWGHGRVGVHEITAFYRRFTGLESLPGSAEQWLWLPENALATATNGKVFCDPSGEFSRWRNHLLGFYPADARLKKIAARCMSIAQAGQYNYPRSVRREDPLAAQYAETKFCADVISLVFLLNCRFTPYYKWMHRAVRGLPKLGSWAHAAIADLLRTGSATSKINQMEHICASLIRQLREEDLSESPSDFLLDHGPCVQRRIQDPAIRALDVWAG